MLLNDNSSNLLASYIYFYNVIRKYIAVDVAQTDRSLNDFVSNNALETFTLCLVVRNHCSGCCESNKFAVLIDIHSLTEYTSACKCDRHYSSRENIAHAVISVLYLIKCCFLLGKCLTADIIALAV